MGALSDNLLAGGCALQSEAIHGQIVKVLDGPDAGKSFPAVREVESDQILMTEHGPDPRAKIVLRFREAATPNLVDQGRVKMEDGSIWRAVRRQEAGFLTNDYELVEKVAKDA